MAATQTLKLKLAWLQDQCNPDILVINADETWVYLLPIGFCVFCAHLFSLHLFCSYTKCRPAADCVNFFLHFHRF